MNTEQTSENIFRYYFGAASIDYKKQYLHKEN